MRAVSRRATGIACVALAALCASCTALSGPGGADEPTVVQFSYDGLQPETVRIAAGGNLTWVNQVSDSQAFVLLPASMASGFVCGENLAPYFQKTEGGFQSLPITDYESEKVVLPCALRPGSYPYEVRIMGAGLGEADADELGRTLRGSIVVE
jgi:hypothetical protein